MMYSNAYSCMLSAVGEDGTDVLIPTFCFHCNALASGVLDSILVYCSFTAEKPSSSLAHIFTKVSFFCPISIPADADAASSPRLRIISLDSTRLPNDDHCQGQNRDDSK